MNTKIEKLADLIKQSKYTVFFGGAGVSTESGISDFRSESGLYTAQKNYGYSPEKLLSNYFFTEKPDLFFRYYKENLIAKNAKPNKAHIALTKLESMNLLKTIITQNIDGLHQSAESQNVLELHGSNFNHYCIKCKEKYTLEYTLNLAHCKDDVIPICEKCGGIVRPDVVLYGENLDTKVFNAAKKEIASAELLIVGGTSLIVNPAARLIEYFSSENIVLINKTETLYNNIAKLVIYNSIGETMSSIIEILS